MDIATIIGLISGTGLILWAIMSKSPLTVFIDGGSIAIQNASATDLQGRPGLRQIDFSSLGKPIIEPSTRLFLGGQASFQARTRMAAQVASGMPPEPRPAPASSESLQPWKWSVNLMMRLLPV